MYVDIKWNINDYLSNPTYFFFFMEPNQNLNI